MVGERKRGDVDLVDEDGFSAILHAHSLDVLNALLDCGADPALRTAKGFTVLYFNFKMGRLGMVTRLLEDPRIQTIVNVQESFGEGRGNTALHYACWNVGKPKGTAIFQRLLQVGGDPTITNDSGERPLNWLQRYHPTSHATRGVVAESLDAEKASFLVKARRVVMAATRTTPPSFLQFRVAQESPLPVVALAPVTEARNKKEKARREFRTMLARLVGVEGGNMPPEVFRVVMELLMPQWDPLRRAMKGR